MQDENKPGNPAPCKLEHGKVETPFCPSCGEQLAHPDLDRAADRVADRVIEKLTEAGVVKPERGKGEKPRSIADVFGGGKKTS